ncbi:MAG: class I SAM-dependent methyltransferase [Anaerofustis sp.]
MNQREYWDTTADSKEFTTPFQMERFSDYVAKYDAVLDVGCGYGRIMNMLAEDGYRNLIGTDFSEKLLERGRLQSPELLFRLQSDRELPFESDRFDAVILAAVLTCILKDDDQQYLLSEINRVLKPRGIIYVNDFLLNEDERNLARYRCFEKELGVYGSFRLEEGAILRHHEESYIKNLFSEFTPLFYETLTYRTMNGHWSNGFCLIGESKKEYKNIL